MKKQMKMIVHQAPGVKIDGVIRKGFVKQVEKKPAVIVIFKDQLFSCSS